MKNNTEQELLLIREILEELSEEAEFYGIEPLTINSKKEWGNSPLKIASVRGNVVLVKALLNAGAEVNMENEDQYTALHHAVSQGHVEIVEVLLVNGANPKLKDRYGNTCFSYSKNEQITKLLSLHL